MTPNNPFDPFDPRNRRDKLLGPDPSKPIMPEVGPGDTDLSGTDQQAVLQQIAITYPFPDDQAKRLNFPEFIRESLRRKWIAVSEGKVVSHLTVKDKIEFRMHSHDSKWGEVLAFLRYDPKQNISSPMVLGFYLLPYDEGTPETEALGTEPGWDVPAEQEALRNIWDAVPKAVSTLKGERRPTKKERRNIMKTPPDWPCPCKSGKVFGLCCGLPKQENKNE